MSKIKKPATKPQLVSYKVSVTKSDIEEGRVGNCSRCPVALAVRRATKANRVSVSSGYEVTVGNYYYQVNQVDKVTEFIDQFDIGEKKDRLKLKPFTFDIEIDRHVING